MKVVLALIVFLFGINLFSKEIGFFSLNVGPSEHFSQYVKVLRESGVDAWALTSEKYLDKFDHSIEKTNTIEDVLSHNDLDNISENEIDVIIDHLKDYKVVIFDCHEYLNIRLIERLAKEAPRIRRVIYYDNPENYVPGGYSETVSRLLKQNIHAIVFANQRLVDRPLLDGAQKPIDIKIPKIGLGFYSLKDVQMIKELKSKRSILRKKLFEFLEIQDTGQQIIVYFGGANPYYYNVAFPHFIKLLENLKNHSYFANSLILLQQHPRAAFEGNKDLDMLNAFAKTSFQNSLQLKKSPLSTFESASLCNVGLYSQTSLCGKFYLADLYLAQVGIEPIEDVCMKEKACFLVKTSDDFLFLFEKSSRLDRKKQVLNSLGYNSDWSSILVEFIQAQLKIKF